MAWQRVTLVVPGSEAESLGEILHARGAISVDVADADAGTAAEREVLAEAREEPTPWDRCRVTALFTDGEDAQRSVEAALDDVGIHASSASVDRLEDEDWVALTQRQFAPIRAGERVWIVPTWHSPPVPDAVNIVLDPGAAFGTGSHPTTQLCLAWLERTVSRGAAALDYGCGSGILGIAALKLGAATAAAVDIDPLALEAARYNASRNSVALDVLDARQPMPRAFDLIVANILANPLRMLAPLLCSHAAPGARLALAGILAEQAQGVIEAYRPWASLEVASRDGDWVLVSGERS